MTVKLVWAESVSLLECKVKKLVYIAGGRIIMTCRNMEKCSKAAGNIRETVKNADLVLMKLDLASMTSIRDFAKTFHQSK